MNGYGETGYKGKGGGNGGVIGKGKKESVNGKSKRARSEWE